MLICAGGSAGAGGAGAGDVGVGSGGAIKSVDEGELDDSLAKLKLSIVAHPLN